MTRILPAVAAALAAILSAAAPLAAQSWTLELGAGRAVHDPVAARLESTTASLGLRWSPAANRWAYASGGAPISSEGPGWGAAGAGVWLQRGSDAAALGVTLALDGYGFAATDSVESGGGATLAFAPGFRVARGPLRIEATAGALGILEAVGDSSETRAMFDGGARLGLESEAGFAIGADARVVAGEEATYPYAGGSATLTRDRVSAWAYAGQWLTDRLPDPVTAVGAGLSVRIAGRTEIAASWRQEPVDPVYFSSPRRTWSVSLSRRLGRAPAPAPVLPMLDAAADGTVTLTLPASEHPLAPVVVGDFNGWTPARMTREGDRWTVRVRVAPGTYHYAFRAADGRVFVPAGVPVVDDGFGGASAVLVVR